MSVNFDARVFNVKDPVCMNCHAGHLDFKLYEDYGGPGVDWLQWYCTQNCGYYINIEIV